MPPSLHLSRPDAHRLAQAMQQTQPCLLCHDPQPSVVGVFQPPRPEAWGAPKGKARLMVYWLCQPCLALPDREARVEGEMAARLLGRRN